MAVWNRDLITLNEMKAIHARGRIFKKLYPDRYQQILNAVSRLDKGEIKRSRTLS